MHYVISLEEVLWGVSLVAVTMTIHGCGMLCTLVATRLMGHGSGAPLSFPRGGAIIILASWVIVLVHLIEVLVWAGFLLWQGALPDPSNAYYFALMQYTTVGSSFGLPQRWRLLDGMLAIAGLMTFAWSTGVLFALAQEFLGARLSVFDERRQRRLATRHAPRAR